MIIREAEITINGQGITYGESMTIRCACSAFLMELQEQNFRDGIGERMAMAYEVNLKAILHKLTEGQ
jgi:hypothetical protein